jgi:hypothetical protein
VGRDGRDPLRRDRRAAVGGALGLVLGMALYATRAGSLFPNRVVFGI